MIQKKLGLHNLVIACVCVIMATGCASLSVRTGSIKGEPSDIIYTGTKIDMDLTADFAKGLVDPQTWPIMVMVSPIFIPLCIGDGALSAVIDTICLPYDLTHKPSSTPKPVVQRVERPEIRKLRELWPEAYFKGDLHPAEGPWLCNAILNSVKLDHYHQCRQIVLDCGWLPDEPVSKVPSKIPGPFTTIPETFHRNGSVLTLFYMDWGVRLRSK